ncbi:MAG: TonB-dependent receptor [Bacteroidales bacterium]
MGKGLYRFCFLVIIILLYRGTVCFSQLPNQVLKGIVVDRESHAPVPGAYITVLNKGLVAGTVTDEKGYFRLTVPAGRINISVSHVGHEEVRVSEILVSTGREVEITVEMPEKLVQAKEIVVSAESGRKGALNQMSSVSTHTVRTDDALRFAGGFYDPSRIVNSFAGVVTANNDESNDIVIRGNSSRGLLWRLEGVEIPNPNHFGDGQGGSGGAYSAITSNAISTFDFFTGAFPAEYGNAISGVMDLNLRKGNTDNFEYAFQTGMIGAELAAEGPVDKTRGSSFLVNCRYVNFDVLEKLNLIDLGSTNFAPRSKDIIFNVHLPSGNNTTFNIFGFAGSSSLGKVAVHDKDRWTSDDDRWEEMQEQGSSVVGIKILKQLKNGNGYTRLVAAYTSFTDKYSEGYVDSSYTRTTSNLQDLRFPSARFSYLLNNKITSRETIRAGLNLQLLGAKMDEWRLRSGGKRESIVEPSAMGLMWQFYFQIRSRLSEKLEMNTGLHTMIYSVNGDISLEPRLGLKYRLTPAISLDAGAGLHSRVESFPVYYNLIKNSSGKYETLNHDLGFTKSFQFAGAIDIQLSRQIHMRAEIYNQDLFNVPVVRNNTSTYSSLNTSEELPASDLVNLGKGYNRGIELTVERHFSSNYYFLVTASLFKSMYRPGDQKWYNTYYNTGYVSNILGGREFYFGSSGANCISLNLKSMFRGGYRYTPVDYEASAKAKRVIYDASRTYGVRLPDFMRVDGGISYRRNNSNYSWLIMADVQNLTGRRNIFRKRFGFSNGSVTETNVFSIGTVPVINFRIEF